MIFFLSACAGKEKPADNGAFAGEAPQTESHFDYERIQASGELIVVTLSGPETYFEYHGRGMGMQYALAENFAKHAGLRLRVETVRDTTALRQLLSSTDADVAMLQLPLSFIRAAGFRAAGARDTARHTSWAVKATSEDLAQALDRWYTAGINVSVAKEEKARMKERRQVRRKVRAPYISREKGLISTYDDHFRAAARLTGWDWRLIAAQCYQESGFDPNAVSWAGAKGLMQIMPATAKHLGLPLEQIHAPAENIAAAARFIKELSARFSDVRDREEKVKFVLAAYNGGYYHVRDAMALARKYGKNPFLWEDVSFFIRGLSSERYYRDPIVKYGYMIGSETSDYVASVVERWRMYGGHVSSIRGEVPSDGREPGRARRENRFTRGTKIYGPDDPEFTQTEKN